MWLQHCWSRSKSPESLHCWCDGCIKFFIWCRLFQPVANYIYQKQISQYVFISLLCPLSMFLLAHLEKNCQMKPTSSSILYSDGITKEVWATFLYGAVCCWGFSFIGQTLILLFNEPPTQADTFSLHFITNKASKHYSVEKIKNKSNCSAPAS